MILELVLAAHVAKADPWCLKVPHLAWLVSIDTAVNAAKETYGIQEPYLSRLRACLLKPDPVK